MDINYLTVTGGPLKVGPFSHAVRAGDFLFITGQMPTLKNDNSKLVSDRIEDQTHQVMKNLVDVLKGCGSSLEKVIFARVYLVNFQDFDKMNKVQNSNWYARVGQLFLGAKGWGQASATVYSLTTHARNTIGGGLIDKS